jgi:urease accessory protein
MHRLFAAAVLTIALAEPALAHHVMDGKLPLTFGQGLLSGLGHPIIGLDHLAAVLAIGALAAAHRAGVALALGYVVAMILGVAVHLQGVTLTGAEFLVALSVILLGVLLARKSVVRAGALLGLFALAGLLHGYALGESIVGAEQAPLAAYLIGLTVIQSAIALAAMYAAKFIVVRRDPLTLRLAGATIAGIGIAILVQQLVPAA